MKKGSYVEHPTRPEWGVGEVVEALDDKVTVNFRHAGLKTLNVSKIQLRIVESAEPVPFTIDMAKLEGLCRQFHADMESNRRGCDDGGIALLVLEDVRKRGRPTEEHKKRLLNWCYTDGTAFQAGVEPAREICRTIYGRLLPDPDSE